jgi:UDP-4-amino-4,6-dideoxy-N-acetyl-beta-L-altrosamine transaminase
MSSSIAYGRQHIAAQDIQAVTDVLTSDFLTQGSMTPRFESAVAERVGVNYGVAVNSATSALHIACLALGLKKGDELWTTPNSFVASASCALYCDASVDFVDIDARTFNISAEALERKIKTTQRVPKVVVVVHFAGEPCDMKAFHQLKQRYGFAIIEDASHALGARYQDSNIGNCRYSDITVFSFHPVKMITSGEGGLATTNNEVLAARMRSLRSHGMAQPDEIDENLIEGGWSYQQVRLGYNYRMTDIAAGLGLSQLTQLDGFIKRRHEIADIYKSECADLPISFQFCNDDSHSSLHLMVIQVAQRLRKALFDFLRGHEIFVQVHYIPIHTQRYYQAMGFKKGDYPNAENYYAGALSLPIYPDLTPAQQQRVISLLRAFFKAN